MPKIKINESAFASEIKHYFETREFDMRLVDATLRTCMPECEQDSQFRLDHKCNGLRFDYTGELMMLLLERAYYELRQKTSSHEYCSGVAKAMQRFADGFGEDADLCYSHFLMHGINASTLDCVIQKIQDNARIIHETRTGRQHFIDSIPQPVDIGFDLKLGFDWGQTDDYFGICCYAYDKSTQWPEGCTGYLAKFSIFTDTTNKIVYGLTVQGQQTYGEKSGKDKKKRQSICETYCKTWHGPTRVCYQTCRRSHALKRIHEN